MTRERRQRSTVTGILLVLCLLVCSHAHAQSIGYTYDSLNRLTRVVYADGTTVSYTYDAAGNRLSLTVNACVFALSASSSTFAGVGGSGTVDITTTAGCTWTAVSNDAFLTVTGGAGGTGSGTATYSVAANNTGSTRAGTLTIAGQTFTVTQSAAFPTVTTTAISAITTTSASSGGTVTADGGAAVTARGVCWATTSNPTTANTCTSDGSGIGSFTSTLTGLSAGTTYHVRAYATSSVGTSYGSDVSFATAFPAPTVVTLPASNITTTGATLSGTVNANGSSTTAVFDYGLTTNYGSQAAALPSPGSGTSPVAVSAAITGLTCNTLYHVRAAGTNASPTIGYGVDLTFTTTACAPQPADTWVTKTSMPTPRRFLSAASVGGVLYAIGGYNDTGGVLPTNEAYDTVQGAWSVKAPMPTPRDFTGAAEIGGKVYVVGGYGGGPNLSVLEVYDPATDTWATKASMPTPRAGLAAAALNGKLYAVGGGTGGPGLVNVEVYDPQSDTWSILAPLPTARGGLALAGIGNKLYAVGGSDNGSSLQTVDIYDSVSNAWSAAAPMPTSRRFLAASVTGGQLYAVGGQPQTGTLEVYDPATNTWVSRAPMTTSRWALGAAAIDGRLYAIGGTLLQLTPCCPAIPLATLEVYQPAAAPPVAPTVTTTAISAITTTSASSGGAVSADGGAAVTARGVCLATTPNPTTTNTCTSDGTGTGTFTSALAGLSAGTTYHARAYATNAVGTSYGSDVSFTTSATPPTVVTLAATNITTTGATLNGTVNPNGSSTTASFEYGRTVSYGSSVSATPVPGSGTSPVAMSAATAGLTCNTLYHFRAIGFNASGTATYGADVTFTTPLVAGCLGEQNGPASPLYLTGEETAAGLPNTNRIKVVQGTTVVRGWDTSGAANPDETAIAVSSTVKTIGRTTCSGACAPAYAAEYTLAGGFIGASTLPSVPLASGNQRDHLYDGTSDGIHNYAVGLLTRNVYAFDANWANATLLFTLPTLPTDAFWFGITYDSSNNSLWVSGHQWLVIRNYTMDGTLLSSFDLDTHAISGGGLALGLALDPADQTLWIGRFDVGSGYVLQQYSKQGVFLDWIRYPALQAFNDVGAEFPVPITTPGPTVVMGAATTVTATSATLNATVNPNGTSTTALFEYGPTTSYGSQVTASPAPGAGTSAVAVSAGIAGLSCNTPYHFRAAATNTGGTTTGSDATFTTAACPTPTRIISLSGNLAFGNVAVSTAATATLTIANTGNSALTVTAITYPSGFSGDWTSGTIVAGGSQTVTVTFAPTAAVSYGGTVTVAANQTSGTPTIAASGTGSGLAQMTTPAPGSTLTASNVQFQWTGGIGVSQYRLDAGTTSGGTDLFTQTVGTNLTATIVGLPFNGSTIYVRLGSFIAGVWQYNSYTYTASATYLPRLGLGSGGPNPRDVSTPPVRTGTERAAGAPAEMTTPAPASTLTASTVEFRWTGGYGVHQYWLTIGTTPDEADLFDADAGTNLSALVAGLPTDGQPIDVRLWSLIGDDWYVTSSAYVTTRIAAEPARMTVPAAGSTLTASTVQFQWTGGINVSQYRLAIGTTPDRADLFTAETGTRLSATVSGLPTSGRLFVRLWSLVDGTWQVNRYTYSMGAPALAELTTPTPGSTLTGSTVAFAWTGGLGVTGYRLQIGTTRGGTDLLNEDEGTSLTATVARLPTHGERLSVRLWSRVDAAWEFIDYTYTAATTADVAAELMTPAPGSTLTASTVAFQWTGGTGVRRYRVEVGTTPGGSQLFTEDAGTNLTAIVANLPTDGRPISVRLWSLVGTAWQFTDYTYTAAITADVAAEMITPAPDSTLTASTVQFAWTGGSGVERYRLAVGTVPGGTDLFDADALADLTTTVAGLPADGRPIYVRLWSLMAGRWIFHDYTYTTRSAAIAGPIAALPRENLRAVALPAVVAAIDSGAARDQPARRP